MHIFGILVHLKQLTLEKNLILHLHLRNDLSFGGLFI